MGGGYSDKIDDALFAADNHDPLFVRAGGEARLNVDSSAVHKQRLRLISYGKKSSVLRHGVSERPVCRPPIW